MDELETLKARVQNYEWRFKKIRDRLRELEAEVQQIETQMRRVDQKYGPFPEFQIYLR